LQEPTDESKKSVFENENIAARKKRKAEADKAADNFLEDLVARVNFVTKQTYKQSGYTSEELLEEEKKGKIFGDLPMKKKWFGKPSADVNYDDPTQNSVNDLNILDLTVPSLTDTRNENRENEFDKGEDLNNSATISTNMEEPEDLKTTSEDEWKEETPSKDIAPGNDTNEVPSDQCGTTTDITPTITNKEQVSNVQLTGD